jgi:lactate dehydrogenase-like 2-hydroxyacid dehydrogenase
MKVFAYACRPDEELAFSQVGTENAIEIVKTQEKLDISTAELAKTYEFVSILGHCDCSAPVLDALHSYGVRYIATRSAGYNNIDVEYGKKLGIKFSRATYSPGSVADFTVMLILMAIRKYKSISLKANTQDFSLKHLQGRELRNLTVGIVGTGRIGQRVIENLSGFGCRILGFDPYPLKNHSGTFNYVTLSELLEKSDIVSLHIPFLPETNKLINAENIKKMKQNSVLINTARGELVDTAALYTRLKDHPEFSVGLDVLEDEFGIFHTNRTGDDLSNTYYEKLKDLPNAIVTQHVAFYTDQAVFDMVHYSLKSLKLFSEGKKNQWEL